MTSAYSTALHGMSKHLMQNKIQSKIAPLLLATFALLVFTGCAANRPGLQSIEPEWSHHEDPAEVTSANDDIWDVYAANRQLSASRSAKADSTDAPTQR